MFVCGSMCMCVCISYNVLLCVPNHCTGGNAEMEQTYCAQQPKRLAKDTLSMQVIRRVPEVLSPPL